MLRPHTFADTLFYELAYTSRLIFHPALLNHDISTRRRPVQNCELHSSFLRFNLVSFFFQPVHRTPVTRSIWWIYSYTEVRCRLGSDEKHVSPFTMAEQSDWSCSFSYIVFILFALVEGCRKVFKLTYILYFTPALDLLSWIFSRPVEFHF